MDRKRKHSGSASPSYPSPKRHKSGPTGTYTTVTKPSIEALLPDVFDQPPLRYDVNIRECPPSPTRQETYKNYWKDCIRKLPREQYKHQPFARGSFGTVYKFAIPTSADGLLYLVCKVIHFSSNDPRLNVAQMHQNFLMEAKMAHHMGEEKIGPRVYDYFITAHHNNTSDTLGVIVMQAYSASLTKAIHDRVFRTPESRKKLCTQLFRILVKLASIDHVCVDLKPDNFVVGLDRNQEFNIVKMIDFGPKYCTKFVYCPTCAHSQIIMACAMASILRFVTYGYVNYDPFPEFLAPDNISDHGIRLPNDEVISGVTIHDVTLAMAAVLNSVRPRRIMLHYAATSFRQLRGRDATDDNVTSLVNCYIKRVMHNDNPLWPADMSSREYIDWLTKYAQM